MASGGGRVGLAKEIELSEENDRLKTLIHDMRADVETMHAEILGKSPFDDEDGADGDYRYAASMAGEAVPADCYGDRSGDRNGDRNGSSGQQQGHEQGQGREQEYQWKDGDNRDRKTDQRFEHLEHRLESTMGEVARLRGERKRLMEVGNELRATLNRHQQPHASLQGQGQGQGHQTPYTSTPMVMSSSGGRHSDSTTTNRSLSSSSSSRLGKPAVPSRR